MLCLLDATDIGQAKKLFVPFMLSVDILFGLMDDTDMIFLVIIFRNPYVTGTSVVGLKYKDGILLAADMGGMIVSTFVFVDVWALLLIIAAHGIASLSSSECCLTFHGNSAHERFLP